VRCSNGDTLLGLNSRRLAGAAAFIGSLALMAGLLPSSAAATFPGENGRIAFRCDTGGLLCLADPDGTVVAQLAFPFFADNPSFSADGRWIALDGVRLSRPQIYIARPDGVGLRRLTGGGRNWDPSFSPDRTQIVFTRRNSGGDSPMITVMEADGSDRIELTKGVSPSFSPGGERIVFSRETTGSGANARVYTMAADGSDVTPVTSGAPGAAATHPSFAPDGELIVMDYSDSSSPTGVYTITPEGTDLAQVGPDGPNDECCAAFSPDGNEIVHFWEGDRCDNSDCLPSLALIAADGSNARRTAPVAAAAAPDWGPVPPGGLPGIASLQLAAPAWRTAAPGRIRTVRATFWSDGDASVNNIRVCARIPRNDPGRLLGAECKSFGREAPGGRRRRAHFRLEVPARADGRTLSVGYTASSRNGGLDHDRTTIKVRLSDPTAPAVRGLGIDHLA
jgi:dipeptidyl aminopeptidase/acylaminoacyl peptidase